MLFFPPLATTLTLISCFILCKMTLSQLPSRKSQSPVGTRHRRKRQRGTSESFHPEPPKAKSRSYTTSAEDLAARLKELDMLPDLIKEKFTTWTEGARGFQMECMRAQALQQDVLLHAATGSGKTGIAAGPHLLPSSKGKVTLFVSPLLSLHDEHVSILSHLEI
jgi:superfamily II DNA helicase RecQ